MKSKAPRPEYLRVLQDPEAPPQLGLPGMPPPVEPKSDQVDGLTEEEQKVWDELIADQPREVVAQLHKLTMEKLVRATLQYREAAKMVAKYGAVIKSPSGYPIQSPYVAHMNKQADVTLRHSDALGFTLASRQRVKTNGKPKPKNNTFEGLKTLDD